MGLLLVLQQQIQQQIQQQLELILFAYLDQVVEKLLHQDQLHIIMKHKQLLLVKVIKNNK